MEDLKSIGKRKDGRELALAMSAADAFQRANQAFMEDHGRPIEVNSANRTFQEQAKLYRELAGKQPVAKPGTSNHERGNALDIQNWEEAKPYLEAVGFKHPNFKKDPWHFDFKGLNIKASKAPAPSKAAQQLSASADPMLAALRRVSAPKADPLGSILAGLMSGGTAFQVRPTSTPSNPLLYNIGQLGGNAGLLALSALGGLPGLAAGGALLGYAGNIEQQKAQIDAGQRTPQSFNAVAPFAQGALGAALAPLPAAPRGLGLLPRTVLGGLGGAATGAIGPIVDRAIDPNSAMQNQDIAASAGYGTALGAILGALTGGKITPSRALPVAEAVKPDILPPGVKGLLTGEVAGETPQVSGRIGPIPQLEAKQPLLLPGEVARLNADGSPIIPGSVQKILPDGVLLEGQGRTEQAAPAPRRQRPVDIQGAEKKSIAPQEFSSRPQANRYVNELERQGIPRDDVRVIQQGDKIVVEHAAPAVAPEIQGQLDKLQADYKQRVGLINRSALGYEQKQKNLKGAGMEYAAQRRQLIQGDSLDPVPGGLTGKELNKLIQKKSGFYKGKEVYLPDGSVGTVISNPYGKVRVESPAGTKSFLPAELEPVNQAERGLFGLPARERPAPATQPTTSIVNQPPEMPSVPQRGVISGTDDEVTQTALRLFMSRQGRPLEFSGQTFTPDARQIVQKLEQARIDGSPVQVLGRFEMTGETNQASLSTPKTIWVDGFGINKKGSLYVKGVNTEGQPINYHVDDFDTVRKNKFGQETGGSGILDVQPGDASQQRPALSTVRRAPGQRTSELEHIKNLSEKLSQIGDTPKAQKLQETLKGATTVRDYEKLSNMLKGFSNKEVDDIISRIQKDVGPC